MKIIKTEALYCLEAFLVHFGSDLSQEPCGDLSLTDGRRLFPDFVIFSTDYDR